MLKSVSNTKRTLAVILMCSFFAMLFIAAPVQTKAAYDDSGDLAQGKTVTVDSIYNNDANYAGVKAVDGDEGTRWASATNQGTHWIQVDLGEAKAVQQVQLNWESAYGTNYTIQLSTDGTNWQTAVTITGNSSAGLKIHSFDTKFARYIKLNCTVAVYNSNISLYSIKVRSGNIALNKTVTVDSTYSAGYEGSKAVDGDESTRWASLQNAGTHWISVDLGESKLVRQVQINWESAYGADYNIQLSADGSSWQNAAAIVGNSTAGLKIHSFDAKSARHVRVYCTKAAAGANISIYSLYIGTADSSTSIDFSTTIANSTPYAFGGNKPVPHDQAAVKLPQFSDMGFTRIRETLQIQDIIPNSICASLDNYKNNVNGIQDSSTWNYNNMYWIDDAKTYGFKVVAVFAYTPAWLSYNGNFDGVPKDWAVWEDIVKKLYLKYQSKIDWLEVWNEQEYWCDLTNSPYKSKEDFQADLHYHTAKAILDAGGTSVPIGGFTFADNNYLKAQRVLELMISRYGLSWVDSNIDFYSCHKYWGDPAELDVLSIKAIFSELGLSTNKQIFLDEWDFAYWWPNTGESSGQEAIGFVGRELTKIVKRGMMADHYALTEMYDPNTGAFYPQAASFRIASNKLGLKNGNFRVAQTNDTNIDSMAAVNSSGKPVVYLANYSDKAKSISVNMKGLNGTSISGQIYIGSISNDGSNVYQSFTLPVNGGRALMTVDMAANSVLGIVIEGSSNETTVINTSIVSNIAIDSTQSVSTAYSGYDGYKACDGIEKIGDKGEWASNGQTNPWIQLNWPSNMKINKVVLMDRPNLTDSANSGTLSFSDGSTINVAFIPNDGSPAEISFPEKSVTWTKFQVSGGSGTNVGLSEFKVFGYESAKPNLALGATATASSQFDSTYVPQKVIDKIIGVAGSGEWASNHELNPWVRLDFSSSTQISKVILYDRYSQVDNANSGTLYFSDGTSLSVTGIPVDGSGKEVTFSAKNVTWVKFQATGGAGQNVGLAEFKVFN